MRNSPRMNLIRRNDSLSFQNCIRPVRWQTFNYFGTPTRPLDLQGVDLVSRAQTEVNAQIILRQVAATTVDLLSLSDPACGQFQPCTDGKTVAPDSLEFKADPVVPRYSVILENQWGAIQIADNNVDLAVIE